MINMRKNTYGIFIIFSLLIASDCIQTKVKERDGCQIFLSQFERGSVWVRRHFNRYCYPCKIVAAIGGFSSFLLDFS